MGEESQKAQKAVSCPPHHDGNAEATEIFLFLFMSRAITSG